MPSLSTRSGGGATPQTNALLTLPVNSDFIDQDTVIPDDTLLLHVDVKNVGSLWQDAAGTIAADTDDDPIHRIDNISTAGQEFIQYMSLPESANAIPYTLNKSGGNNLDMSVTLNNIHTNTYLLANKNYLNLYKYTIYFVGQNYCQHSNGTNPGSGPVNDFITTPYLRWSVACNTYGNANVNMRIGRGSASVLSKNVNAVNAVQNYNGIYTFTIDSSIGEIIPARTMWMYDKDNVDLESTFTSNTSVGNEVSTLQYPGSYEIALGNIKSTSSTSANGTSSQTVKEFRVYTGAHDASERLAIQTELKAKWGIA